MDKIQLGKKLRDTFALGNVAILQNVAFHIFATAGNIKFSQNKRIFTWLLHSRAAIIFLEYIQYYYLFTQWISQYIK